MKLLIITIIALAVPVFFAFVFVMSTVSKLNSLRNRCREIRERIQDTSAPNSRTGSVLEPQVHEGFKMAAERYDTARRKFPANLLAGLCGFHEIEPLSDRSDDDSREAP